MIFFISRFNVSRYAITLPSGKKIVLMGGKSYTTDDPDEIKFLSSQKGLGVRKVEDREYRIWATKKFNELPTCDNKELTKEDLTEFLLSSPQEKLLKSILESNGYIKDPTIDDSSEDKDAPTPPKTDEDATAGTPAKEPVKDSTNSDPKGKGKGKKKK